MHEQTTYRCINPACTRTMPRPVAFCPYCGTEQASGRVPSAAAAAVAAAAASPVPAVGRAAAAPPPPAPPVPPVPPAPPVAPVPPAAPGTAFGHSGSAPATPPPATPRAGKGPYHIWGRGAAASPPPVSTGPRGREPIKLRWWLAILVVLSAVWLWAKPSSHKVERRIAHAVALAHACKAREAQDELIALRQENATAEQLEQLQQSLNDEAAACTRRRQRDKAWRDTSDAVDAALASPTDASIERARSRLGTFTRRWGEDDHTRALQGRIDEARHPLAAPSS